MKKDDLQQLFDGLKNQFDVEEPSAQHKQRFLEKLSAQNQGKDAKYLSTRRINWKSYLAVAATIVVLIALTFNINQTETSRDLASVSPEMSETQDFFTSTIATELSKIQNEKSPEVQNLISDAMKQLEILEKDYESLKQDLTVSGDDNRVIYAMISNLQNRIDLLQNTLKQIKNVKQLNKLTNENKTTV